MNQEQNILAYKLSGMVKICIYLFAWWPGRSSYFNILQDMDRAVITESLPCPCEITDEARARVRVEVAEGYRRFASRASDFEYGAYRRTFQPSAQQMQNERNRNGLDGVRMHVKRNEG